MDAHGGRRGQVHPDASVMPHLSGAWHKRFLGGLAGSRGARGRDGVAGALAACLKDLANTLREAGALDEGERFIDATFAAADWAAAPPPKPSIPPFEIVARLRKV